MRRPPDPRLRRPDRPDPQELREERQRRERELRDRTEAERRTRRGGGPAHGRRRAQLSLDAVLDGAVELLDEAGEPALTFRALAGRLGGGVGSLYWYVSSKDELLDLATDRVVGEILREIEAQTEPDPLTNLRASAVTLFDRIVERPWLAAYFMRNNELQPNSLRLYEHLGQQVLRLDLTPKQRFHAVSSVIGFAVGTAADLGQEPPEEFLRGDATRDELLDRWADGWRAKDPQEFPFLHDIADEFAHHDDTEQFRAGLDLLLAGLRLQVDGG